MTAATELRELLSQDEDTESLLQDGDQRHILIEWLADLRRKLESLQKQGGLALTVGLGDAVEDLERRLNLLSCAHH